MKVTSEKMRWVLLLSVLLLLSSVQAVSAQDGYVYTTQWGSLGSGAGQFNGSAGVGVDSAGCVYVADFLNNRIEKFDSSGTFITQWGSLGSGAGQFNGSAGVAVDSAGYVYVADTYNSRIQKFTSSGTFVTQWGDPGWNPEGFEDEELYRIALDSDDNVYVVNTGDGEIHKFTSTGTPLPEFNLRVDAVSGLAVDRMGNIYLSLLDASKDFFWGGVIFKINPSDISEDSIAILNVGVGWETFGEAYFDGVDTGVTLDSAGNIYTFDWINHRILKFDSSGIFITTLGSGDGQLSKPYGIAVDNAGNVYVSDPGNNQIMKFAPKTLPVQSVTAAFSTSGNTGQSPLSVRFQDISSGSPTAWKWNFGDGTTSNEQNPTHIYTRNGAYSVSLSVYTDYAVDTCTQNRCIIVNTIPVANFTANATSGRTPFAVQFTDQSTGATSYQWQFGDGTTSTEQNPVHTYTQPGTYTVTLVASSGDYGSVFMEKPGYITVNDPPTVGFSANVTSGLSPLAVQFSESTTGSVQYFYWQFGDGSTSFDQNPIHVYDTAGRYTVSLYAIGSNGTQVKTIEQYINVTAPVTPTPIVTATSTVTPVPTATGYLPVANFTVTPQGGAGSMGIQVADTSVNATSVRYDLGDGTTTTYPNFRYTYWQAGTYTIKQTATNAAGSSTWTIAVTVPATTPPVSPTVTVTPTTTVTVQPTTGTASFTVSPTTGKRSLTVALTDTTPGGNPVSWRWSCGNGQSFSGKSIGLNRIWFNNAGTYIITLTVTDANGSTRTATKTITVTN